MNDVPSFCRKWISADLNRHGAQRLVCTLPWAHGGDWHYNATHDWYWPAWRWLRRLHNRDHPTPVREWLCRGRLDGGPICGRVTRSTEDEARVKGWKIGTRDGERDALCPTCAKPDATTAKLLRELARSAR